MKKIGFLLYNNLEELDLVGPWEIFGMWNQEADGPECLTVAQASSPVSCSKGLKLLPDVSFKTCPPLDIIVVPGGRGSRIEVNNSDLIDFIVKCSIECKYILSVCTGVFLLERAGLMKNRKCTTHWESHQRLKDITEVKFQDARFTEDDNIWTSAGISAGIDMSLAFIAKVAGEDIAAKVQLCSEYFPEGKVYSHKSDFMESLPAIIKKYYNK